MHYTGTIRPAEANDVDGNDSITALDVLTAANRTLDDPVFTGALTDVLVAAIACFDDVATSPRGSALVSGLDGEVARIGYRLVVTANFADSEPVLGQLGDSTVLCLVALLLRAGETDLAARVLAEAMADSSRGSLTWGTWMVHCARCGCDPYPLAHWPAAIDLADAQAGIAARGGDPHAYVQLAGAWFAANDFAATGAALATALALPVSETTKLPLADDIARFVALAFARGEQSVIGETRFAWPLAALPLLCASVAQCLSDNTPAFVTPAVAERAIGWVRALPSSPYPSLGGRPRVDIVWLEITNVCNQRCSFCPDMFREEATTWLPLDQIKAVIDQMAETLSVGSMQLNAYGEPLLHPQISEILAYIRERRLPWPTFFTSHGMTLVPKKLAQLSHNYPAGIAISLHNDSQESYDATRRAKIGDYETLVDRVTALLRQMVVEQADCHLRLYQMVHNANADVEVDPLTRAAFPGTAERMSLHVRKWETIAAKIAAEAPAASATTARVNDIDTINAAFDRAEHGDTVLLPILEWTGTGGQREQAFISARPVGTYANLLLEYDDRWTVDRSLVNDYACSFTQQPSLAVFATGRLGICCLDLNSTATFGALSDYPSLIDAITSPQALAMFGQLANGVATSRGCQICLSSNKQFCASTKRLSGPDPRLS